MSDEFQPVEQTEPEAPTPTPGIDAPPHIVAAATAAGEADASTMDAVNGQAAPADNMETFVLTAETRIAALEQTVADYAMKLAALWDHFGDKL